MWSKLSAGLQIVQEQLDHVLDDVSVTTPQVNVMAVDICTCTGVEMAIFTCTCMYTCTHVYVCCMLALYSTHMQQVCTCQL